MYHLPAISTRLAIKFSQAFSIFKVDAFCFKSKSAHRTYVCVLNKKHTMMKKTKSLFMLLGMIYTVSACQTQQDNEQQMAVKSVEERQPTLHCTPETEAPFSGEYWDSHENGNYTCSNCNHILFTSSAKFDSGTGWPSFDEPAVQNGIEERLDTTMSMIRTEVICANCKSHLGHLFADGLTNTGLRYCVNSYALEFEAENTDKAK